MKILFATPPISHVGSHDRQQDNGTFRRSPTLGLLFLAAVARRLGHTVSVLDGTAMRVGTAEFHARLDQFAPEILALSATTAIVTAAGAVAQAAKERWPQLLIVLGGPHVSATPRETLVRFAAIDVAVIGEGEATLAELLATLSEERPLDSVSGLYIRSGEELLSTGPRAPIADLDTLSLPAWDLLEGFPHRYGPAPFMARQLPVASLVSSRGCPNRCIFCDSSVFGEHCRFQSAEVVVTMIRTLHERFGVREICFDDDTFVTRLPRVAEICNRLIELNLGVTWSCLARVNQVTAESLALMRQAGCWQVSFGIESGSQRILDTIGKNTTLAQIRDALAMTRAAGMRTRGFFIVGHPGECHETLQETIDFALALPLNDITVALMTPFPGTELHRRAAEFGSMIHDWDRLNESTPVFIPFGLSAADLLAAKSELLRRFYLRPRIVADYLGRLLVRPSLALSVLRGGAALLRKTR